MSFIVSGSGGGSNFAPHPEGGFHARCIRIIDLGTHRKEFKGDEKDQRLVKFVFESTELMPDGEMAGKPFIVSTRQTLSLNAKANLSKLLEGWMGRRFTEVERKDGYDIKRFLGKPCVMQIVHSTKGDKTYANIQSLMAPMKGTNVAPPVNPLVIFTLNSFDRAVYDALSEYDKKTIAESREYKSLGKKHADEAPAYAGDDDLQDGDIPF